MIDIYYFDIYIISISISIDFCLWIDSIKFLIPDKKIYRFRKKKSKCVNEKIIKKNK